MGWEKGIYYTRSRRVGGKVKREYVGRGLRGKVAAELDTLKREERKAKASAARDKKLDPPVDILRDARTLMFSKIPSSIRKKLDLPPREGISTAEMIDSLIVQVYYLFQSLTRQPGGRGENQALRGLNAFTTLLNLKNNLLCPFRVSGNPEEVAAFFEGRGRKMRPDTSPEPEPEEVEAFLEGLWRKT